VAEEPRVRLDKWLWAARFYKTRALATEAVDGGRVHVNGDRVKAARPVRLDDRLEIRTGPDVIEVRVRRLSPQRGPATVAQGMYEESEASRTRRETMAEQRRLVAASTPRTTGRPDKRSRRRIIRFREDREGRTAD
jgi:ribosome-associated heat shock protein Hsp15